MRKFKVGDRVTLAPSFKGHPHFGKIYTVNCKDGYYDLAERPGSYLGAFKLAYINIEARMAEVF